MKVTVMKKINFIKKLFKDFNADQQGGVLPLVGLSILILFMASGFAIDYTRAQIVRERLQWAVDAGALAGAKTISTDQKGKITNLGKVKNEASDYFRANFPVGYMDTRGGSISVREIGTVNGKGNGLRFTIDGLKMENYFTDFLGIKDIKMSATADVNTVPLSPIDLVFGVDVSGSMAYRDDTALRCLDSGMASSNPSLCLCNAAGSSSADSLCPRNGTGRLVNAKPFIKRLREKLNADTNRFGVVPWDHRVNTGSGMRSGPGAPNYCTYAGGCSSGLTKVYPLSKNQNSFNNYIGTNTQGLDTSNNTDHANGMYWTYRQLKGVKTENRIIVFITDGVPSMDYTRPAHIIGVDDVADQRRTLQELVDMCTMAKKEGIVIYTVIFNLAGPGARVAQIYDYMRRCATGSNNFYQADSSRALETAIEKIGDSYMTMRLTK